MYSIPHLIPATMSFEFVPPYAKGHITQNLAKCSFSILRCLHQFCSILNLCYGASSRYRERKQTETRQGVLRNCSVQPSNTSCSACVQIIWVCNFKVQRIWNLWKCLIFLHQLCFCRSQGVAKCNLCDNFA